MHQWTAVRFTPGSQFAQREESGFEYTRLGCAGSQQVKRAAEAEGLDRIFKEAGAEWREPGCSMCIAMNGDALEPGQYAVSTSNRNFEGRQGRGGRTFLASPLTAAATAIYGVITTRAHCFSGGIYGTLYEVDLSGCGFTRGQY